jgi:hypothetical protein
MPKTSTQGFDLDAFSLAMGAETDRACGVLGAALLDARLKAVFERHLSVFRDELLGKMRPLGSFSARIRAACALSWISEDARVDLDTIRDIRNDFAHSWDHKLDFDSQSIADRCKTLRSAQAYLDGFDVAAAAPGRRFSAASFMAVQAAFKGPRRRYELAISFLSQYLDEIFPEKREYAGTDLLAEIRSLSATSQPQISGSVTVSAAPVPSKETEDES